MPTLNAILTCTLAWAPWAGSARAQSPADAVALARDLVATLDAAERPRVLLALDAPDRRHWRRDPSPRPGLALRDMDARQRALVDALVASVLDTRGQALVAGIRAEQDLLGEDEEGLGDGYYWLALYGEPGGERWAWRLGGHHVSVHAAYAGATPVGVTPLLLGGNRQGNLQGNRHGDRSAGWDGYERLLPRETLARALALSCDAKRWRRACTSERAQLALSWSEPELRPLPDADEGLPLSALEPEQRETLLALVAEYTSLLRAAPGVPARDALERAADRVFFAWTGDRGAGAPHSYRVQAPGLLIEYSNSGGHIHSLLRTGADWGDDPAADGER